MKLPLIPHDKANHFIYGFALFLLTNLFILHYYSLGVVFVFAIGKEFYDHWKYGGFDWKDLVTTVIPGLLMLLKQLIFNQ